MKVNGIRVALLLAKKQILKTNKIMTSLIIIVMMMTFLSLVVISGILVGLIEGGNKANREQYTGDVIITTRKGEESITHTSEILSVLHNISHVGNYTARYISGARIEANYLTKRDFKEATDGAGTQLAGIDLANEEATTHLSKYMVEGSFLEPGQSGYIVLGSNLLDRYSSSFGDGFDSLENIRPGSTVRVIANGISQEFIVKGIIKSKVNEVSIRAFIPADEFIRIYGRPDLNANEITIAKKDSITDDQLKAILVGYGFDQYGKIQTSAEAIPQFLIQIRDTFGLLGNVIGFVGLFVAVITIFIVIFINALTRRKYIGIMKAIGIRRQAIELAYAIQSMFYAIIGSGIGLIITYALLVPLFQAHPLDFPFSDGILVAPFPETMIKLGILFLVTIIAGFLPARIIAKQNTLNSLLDRR